MRLRQAVARWLRKSTSHPLGSNGSRFIDQASTTPGSGVTTSNPTTVEYARLASAGDDKTVRIWDPATGATERIVEDNIGWVSGCARCRCTASSCWPPPTHAMVRRWDAATAGVERVR